MASWTAAEDKNFERALAMYADHRNTREKWEKVATMVGGGKSATDVERHFHVLEEDVFNIESGRVPFPRYRAPSAARVGGGRLNDDDHRRMTYLNMQ